MCFTLRVPDGIEGARVHGRLLRDHHIGIGGGLGQREGQIWHTGLMGHNSTPRTVFVFSSALESVLQAEGYFLAPAAALAAAGEVYA